MDGELILRHLSVFVIVGCSNAVNLTDGLDGLAAGTVLLLLLYSCFFFFIESLILARYLNIIYLKLAKFNFLVRYCWCILGFCGTTAYLPRYLWEILDPCPRWMLGAAVLLRRGFASPSGAIFCRGPGHFQVLVTAQ